MWRSELDDLHDCELGESNGKPLRRLPVPMIVCRCGNHTSWTDGICDVCRMLPDAEQAAVLKAYQRHAKNTTST